MMILKQDSRLRGNDDFLYSQESTNEAGSHLRGNDGS